MNNSSSPVINTTETLNTITIGERYLFATSVYSQVIACFCAVLSCMITLHQMYFHLKNYTCVSEQRYIIRVLVLVPAYAIYSFLSVLLAIHAMVDSIYIDFIHDTAEAFAIYSFLALCYQYLGGEGNIMLELTGKTINFSILYSTCCFAGKPYTILFLRFCKIATLQYTLIKPITSFTSMILMVTKKYTVGDFGPTSGYLYLFLINNVTVTLAVYGLLLFYFANREQLKPFSPLLKFATIKSIIFFSFWQDVLFSILEWSHVITMTGGYSATLIAGIYKNLLICIELVVVAVALRYAFPYSIYVLHHPPRLVFDLPPNDSYWSNDEFMFATKPSVGFKPAKDPTINNSINDKSSHFTPGTFVSYAPSAYSEPLPWDIADSQLNSGGYRKTWNIQNPNVIPSISASIKATIDPTDILVDAVHNFHPTYRHYTQTQMDEDS
ncbi:Transmembrane protein isoform 1 [Schistosoma japonicum]|uniref:Transmembrane protein isoform 1 n=1 Tax=Schistosoma japonicum TaxID=6182 RepID=A0A4Z2DUS7_SCHJA|nr:Transmembrane protein 184A [Schistosoma japonicum]KAH8866957.1 Transmembrane protein 184A [Schistosoma japonicum]KAH8866958.1 Transmembrane protein 184A [Schistosoma japonicum]KAH8866960.1 Transmembrane protein 184A [Schistosoma japonicum]TNN20301.1 Transmembrane protein isoform 1 [Schistosoma japonicum]